MSDLVKPEYQKFINPFYMAATAAILCLVLMILGKLAGFEGVAGEVGEFPWMTSASIILLFVIFSSMFSLFSENISQYYKLAIPAFVALIAANSLMAYVFSGFIWINDVGSYRGIYFILIMGYLMLQLMTRFIKKIMNVAQKEDDEFRKRSNQ